MLSARGFGYPFHLPLCCSGCDTHRTLDTWFVDPVWHEIVSEKERSTQSRPSIKKTEDRFEYKCHRKKCGRSYRINRDRAFTEFARAALAGESKIYWPPRPASKLRLVRKAGLPAI